MENIAPLSVLETEDRIVIKITGSLAGEQVEALRTAAVAGAEVIKSTAERLGHKVKVVLDMSAFGGEYEAEAITIMADLAKANAPFVEKTAAFGSAEKGVMAGEVATALAGRDNIQFFDTESEALTWLIS